MRFLIALLLASTAWAGAAQEAARPAPAPAPAASRLSEQWTKAWTAKDLEALVALYADDAVFFPSVGTRFTGRAAIRDLFAQALPNNKASLRVFSKGGDETDRLAFDSGDYEETTPTDTAPRIGRGQYLLVSRRAPDGTWRIVAHMWTDVPTAASK